MELSIFAHSRSSNMAVRIGVAMFFVHNRLASGLDELLDAWQADPSAWVAVEVSWGPLRLLRELLLEAVVCRLMLQPDSPALEVLRWAVVTPPGLGPFVYQIARVDQAWALDHIDEILAADPNPDAVGRYQSRRYRSVRSTSSSTTRMVLMS